MPPRHPIADSYEQILRGQLPNLFRLYLNPYVTQTCFCLDCYVRSTWPSHATHSSSVAAEGGVRGDAGEYQTFLANGFDEALSGAIKLARYSASLAGLPKTGLVLDVANHLETYAGAPAVGGGRVEFLPGLVIVGKSEGDVDAVVESGGPFGLIVLVATADDVLDRHADALRLVVRRDAPLVITCVNRESLRAVRRGSSGVLRELAPDIVVFDESFADHAVPFGAFTARKALYDYWNRPGKTTFHSTTYQPNTISTLHFVKCLEKADPEFHASVAQDLAKIHADLGVRKDLFRRLYSPSLYRAIRATGFDTAGVRAAGDFVFVNGRRIFDAVGGVACSVRGHNPSTYAEEIDGLGSWPDCQEEVTARLRDLTGLEHLLPAVSGATAVESALKIALVCQFPRRHVLALKAGFGGKTLLALTGTANPAYKEHIGPLYADVLYVDPFAPDAEARIEAVLEKCAVAVVQVELVQAVGGVRRIPDSVVRYLEGRRHHWGFLLLVDEVQTGMYRTGPFALSRAMGLAPDLLLLGKGTSDMMFPFALLLYSAAIQRKLGEAMCDLPAAIRKQYGYEFGYKTLLNVLRRAEELSLSRRVDESGALFARLLRRGLASCKAVHEVRVYGLLIGIELNAGGWPRRWFRNWLYSFYLYGMLRHRRYPVLVGFCQYEPNVLKITPALTVATDDIRKVCATIVNVLKRPFPRLLGTVLSGLLQSSGIWRKKHVHDNVAPHELAAR